MVHAYHHGDNNRNIKNKKEPYKEFHESSPLLIMQQNYQRKLYAEKERKMVEIFRKNQQDSLQTISNKSSSLVKSYFGKKIVNDNIDQLKTKKKRISHLPPLTKTVSEEVKSNKKLKSKHRKQIKLNKPITSVVSPDQPPEGRSAFSNHLENNRLNNFKQKEHDEPTDTKILHQTQEFDPKFLVGIRKRQQKNKKQELLKLNKKQLNTNIREHNKFSLPPEENHNNQNNIGKNYNKSSKLYNLNQNYGHSNTQFDSDTLYSISRESSYNNYAKAARKQPFTSVSPEERKEINFSKTYTKGKRKTEPKEKPNVKVDSPFGMANLNKPVKVRRDSRSSSNYSMRTPANVDISHTDFGKTYTKRTNHRQLKTPVIESTPVVENFVEQPKFEPSGWQAPAEFAEQTELATCSFCGRNFNSERLTKHKKVCQKNPKKKTRKVYDMGKMRKKGTEMENYSSLQQNTKKVKPKRKSNWRFKHEEFMQTIKHAKNVQNHIQNGGNPKDISPPPPSSNPDYVQCKYCKRKFAPSVAERHIPKCKDTRNRPKPPPTRKQPKARPRKR